MDGATHELSGMVREPIIDLPSGYTYGVTRYADLILKHAFPQKFDDLVSNLGDYYIDYEEDIAKGGGSRAQHTKRHDDGLIDRGWNKHRVSIQKLVDGEPIFRVKNHEIDVFTMGDDGEYPGLAVEMEWNNKDPFYHRDLSNFQALHREGVIAVGIVVTRGHRLQEMLEHIAKHTDLSSTKFGKATTHWDKLVPMINMGGGGECPLLCVGIEPERVNKLPLDVLSSFKYSDGTSFQQG